MVDDAAATTTAMTVNHRCFINGSVTDGTANWLTAEQARHHWQVPDPATLKGKRDRRATRGSVGLWTEAQGSCGTSYRSSSTPRRPLGHVDLVGKGRHIRTIRVPDWVKDAVDSWMASANITAGRLFRFVCRAGKTWGPGITERVVWHVVKDCARRAGIEKLAPHDLRRTCARLFATTEDLFPLNHLHGSSGSKIGRFLTSSVYSLHCRRGRTRSASTFRCSFEAFTPRSS